MIDDRGRVFGRVNLVDAALLVVLLGFIPLAYGAYGLFRAPAPKLTSVEPAKQEFGPNLRVTIHGENLRPYMRVSFNEVQGRSFLFASVNAAEVELGTLSPGVYDVVLYDYAQERARLPKALTITPPPLPATSVVVVGMLVNLPEAVATQVKKGMTSGFGPLLDAGKPLAESTRVGVGEGAVEITSQKSFRVPMSIPVPCQVQMVENRPVCVGSGVVLKPDAMIQVQTPFGMYPFQVSQVRGTEPLEAVEARVRLTGHPATFSLVRAGDVDFGDPPNELAAGARVVSTGTPRGIAGGGAEEAAADVVLLLKAQHVNDTWWYGGSPIRAGSAFVLRTSAYELHGNVLTLTPKTGSAAQ